MYGVVSFRTICISSPVLVSKVMSFISPSLLPSFVTTSLFKRSLNGFLSIAMEV